MNRKRGWLLALSLGLLAGGAGRGEVLVVFRKAVNICLECIGVG